MRKRSYSPITFIIFLDIHFSNSGRVNLDCRHRGQKLLGWLEGAPTKGVPINSVHKLNLESVDMQIES